MNNNIRKKLLSCILVVAVTFSCVSVAYASGGNYIETSVQYYNYENLPQEFDEDVTFDEIELGILDFIENRGLDIEVGSEAYTDLMYSFLFDEIENVSDITLRYFGDYASVYVVKVQELLCQNKPELVNEDVKAYDVELNGSIVETKRQNLEKIEVMYNVYSAENEVSTEANSDTSANSDSFSLSRAQELQGHRLMLMLSQAIL